MKSLEGEGLELEGKEWEMKWRGGGGWKERGIKEVMSREINY